MNETLLGAAAIYFIVHFLVVLKKGKQPTDYEKLVSILGMLALVLIVLGSMK